MLLFTSDNPRYLDFSNATKGNRALSNLGFTVTRNTTGAYYDKASGMYKFAAANTARYDSAGTSGRTGLLVEEGQTNLALRSSDFSNASWVGAAVTRTTANISELIEGGTATQITTAATGNTLSQSCGTFVTSQNYVASVIVEESSSNPSETVDLQIYNVTDAVSRGRTRLTFATGARSTVTTAPTDSGSYQIATAGPNGGRVWHLWIRYAAVAGDNGDTKAIYVYTSAVTAAPANLIIHHAQFVNAFQPTSPIVTAGASAGRADDDIVSATLPSWWNQTATSMLATIDVRSKPEVYGAVVVADDGSADNLFGLAHDSSDGAVCILYVATTPYTVVAAGAATDASPDKVGASQTDGLTFSAIDGTVSADGNQVGAPTLTGWCLGSFLGLDYFLNGKIHDLRIINTALSSAELDAYTT
jgi:hypothetical protein